MSPTLQFVLLILGTFAGIFSGILIGYFAKEELNDGRQYFKKLSYFLFSVILLFFLFINQSILFLVGISICIILLNFHKQKELFFYWITGLILTLSYFYNGFTIIAPLIFLYGFPVGSEYIADRSRESIGKIFFTALGIYSPFVIISLIVYLFAFIPVVF